MTVIAEGVETYEQHALLFAERCDQVQGYLTGRPRGIEEYADLTKGTPMPNAQMALAG